MKILFVAARFPSPARQGFQVRAYHQIRLLSARHRITLVAFATSTPTLDAHDDVARYCERVVTVPLTRGEMVAGLARGLLSNRPLQTALYETPAMRRAVAALIAEQRFDVVHVQLARMARHLEGVTLPRVVDLIDALSLNMERRASRDPGPARFAAAFEAKRLQRYERWLCRTFAHATVVSRVDRDAIGNFANLSINPNGVDVDRFPFATTGRDPHRIVFTGNLGYFPNVDAVEWFVREVLPRVQRVRPEMTFVAAGARPHRRMRALEDATRSVVIRGDVPDVGSVLARAAVAVAPMRAGSGQPLKILEAMASGTPIVATSIAASGIEGVSDRHLLFGDDAESFAAQVLRFLSEPALAHDLAHAARGLVEEHHRWERSVAALEGIYESVVGSS